MRMGFDLTLEQTQKLVMTPELRQAIQILQFNNQELLEYIEHQMESNPVLELDLPTKNSENIDDINRKADEIDWKEYFDKYDDISYVNNMERYEKKQSFENFIATKTHLKDHLISQLNLNVTNRKHKKIGKTIIENIDKNGYLDCSVEEISKQLKVPEKEVENVLRIIQTFDPIGVGARNLKECLNIQLKAKNEKDPLVYLIVDKYLEDVAQNKVLKISKTLNISSTKIQKVYDMIRSLEPKPGRGFTYDSDEIKYITPDVILEEVDGEYIIIINDITAPRLTINSFYKKLLKKADDQVINNFLTEKLNSAMWLIKSIEQRRMTLYKVVQSIIKFQKDFFEKGDKALKPLILKEVADDIGVHESTVSRATNGKFIQTPRGTFELKFFFSNGVTSGSGDVSSTSIKSIIKELIDKENPQKPLSDQQIANIFKNKNIKISRRTVAKYRDELNIPSSSMRKRFS